MSEHDEQTRLIEYCRRMSGQHPELALVFAVPNGSHLPWKKDRRGNRYSPEAQRLKEEGLKSGVPDLVLPVARQQYHSLFIELKHGKNKPSENQVWWLDQLSKQGHLAVVCYGADEAIAVLREYLGIDGDASDQGVFYVHV